MIVKRLSYYADKIVTGNQTAFLKHRGMEENGLTHYLLHEQQQSTFGGMPTGIQDYKGTQNQHHPAIIFLDQEKAFDRIRWTYLFHVMRYYGIPEQYVRFYEAFYGHGINTVYLVMGHLTNPVALGQGGPQGDPSSPVLYLIKQQPFMDRLMLRGIFMPIYITNNTRLELETHGFADDLDTFITSKIEHEALKEEMDLHDRASNSKMNMEKLRLHSLTPLENTTMEWRSAYPTQDEEYTVVGFPIRSDGDCPTDSIMKRLKEIRRRVGFWAQQKMSIRGRAQLANTLLTSTLWHGLQLCPLENRNGVPNEIMKTLKPLLSHYVLASRLRYYISWDTLTKAKEYGGMGLIDPERMCTAMHGRAIAKALLKSTQPHTNTNSAELLLESLKHTGFQTHPAIMHNRKPNHDDYANGLYYWIIRKGKTWHEHKKPLSPFMARIAETFDKLCFEPHRPLNVHHALHLPIYSAAYRSSPKTPMPSKKKRQAIHK